ncbi:phage tail repeat-like family, partial [Trichomonas vaginalis G3]|uniref:phage tail repeat-like family n=1 Tax=Trichomonas vaginalis (strain ATCC PRA-98 / G3) TaxID=412133 RepID=UPI0021E626C6
MNSKIKGITDDITSIPPEEQRYYALNAFPKVLKIGRFNLNEEFIKGFLNDIMKKADKEYVNDELAKKADISFVNDELAKKADKTYVNDELAKKADKTYVNDELAKKADKEYVNDELAKKADKEYVNEKDNEIIERVEWYHERTSKILKTKADTGWVSECLDLKADISFVNDELAKKADISFVNDELAKKADKEYVNDELAKKADKEYVNDELGKKADKEYVNDELAKKADKEYVNDELAKKADISFVNEIYQSLVGTKNIETIVGDFSVNEENKYFRWEFVQSLRNGIRYKLIPKNNNEMYVGYIKNNGTQVKVPLDNNCYLNLYGDEQKKYLRVYEMTDMTLSNVAPAPYYYDYGVDAH